MTQQLNIVEVSPRDGLQNEPVVMATEGKLELIRRAVSAGVRRIEVASFVHPKLMPQMADAEAVCEGLNPHPGVEYIGLILNRRGLKRALATNRLQEVGCVAVASDGFGVKNQGQTSDQSLAVCLELISEAKAAGLSAQVTISVAFGCPFDGLIDPQRVVDMAARLAEAGPREIALADTIGVAVPGQVSSLFQAVREAVGPEIPLRAHFHNTRNTGIANAYAALMAGITILDASIGGIGGCPFAPRATGNIATEDLLYMLDGMGFETGLDLEQIIRAAGWLGSELHRPVPGMLSRAGSFP
jgi:hydroxymethylglutaryl-CoA lyase